MTSFFSFFHSKQQPANCVRSPLGIKFVLLTTPSHPTPDVVLRKVYEVYADHLKDPFYTVEMPITRSEAFDTRMASVCRGLA